jgi:hypothetical protein
MHEINLEPLNEFPAKIEIEGIKQILLIHSIFINVAQQ